MPDTLLSPLKKALLAHSPARIIVGLSGGLDSSALLNALIELKSEDSLFTDTPVIAVHVHHGLSQHADDWLDHCQRFCDERTVKLITERVILNADSGSVENAARNARYDVFARHMEQGDLLLLAHHQNDQIETFMMRLMRGSGLTGLSAMQSVRHFSKGLILRPWLRQTRSQLEEYVAIHHVPHIEDESNTDTQFDRNWWRHKLLPSLNARYPQASVSIVKSIEVLQQERELLNELLTPIYNECISRDARFSSFPMLSCEALLAQPRRVGTQLIRMWLQQQHVYPGLNNEQVDTLFTDVLDAKDDASPIYQWQHHQIRRYSGKLFLLPQVGEGSGKIKAKSQSSQLDSKQRQLVNIKASHADDNVTDKGVTIDMLKPLNGRLHISYGVRNGLRSGEYEVITYQAGLSAKPLKRPTKTLKKWFQEFAVPPWLRESWPVLVVGEQVVCVPSLFVCEGFTVLEGVSCEYKSSGISLHMNTF